MNGVYSDHAVTLPTAWLVWLATSAARMTVYRMQGLHEPLRLVHILGTAAFFGGILLLDLRLMGALGREIAVDALSRLVLPVVHLAFVLLLASGLWLFLYDPIQTGSHSWFAPKLLLIVLGLGNAALFTRPLSIGPRTKGLRAIGAGALTRHARLAGALSIALWGGVIACATANQEERPLVRGRAVEHPSPQTADDAEVAGMRELDGAHWGNLFASPLLEHVWADADTLNPALRRAILEHAARDPGEARSNVGGWHSEAGGLEFCGEAGAQLIRHMGEMVEEATFRLYEQYGRTQEALGWTLSAWANVNRAGDGNERHTHPGATWSGVYYVDDGEEDGAGGEGTAIHLSDPCTVRTNIFFPDLLSASVRFRPQPGLMILFPSYVPHAVPVHRGAGMRISVAFNVRKDPFP